ncbi:hypothetical protein KY363_00780 [Candidatus Woesearchaeota archaeon]|nr:hypothetical protein [Candidatus Woesearchaeota archaeon]
MPIVNPPKHIVYSKKAQDAGSAATLIAVIALLIVFYLLFIPPSFRDQILEGNTSESGGSSGTGTSKVNETVMKANPGSLSKISSDDIEHTVPSVTLYSKTESKVLDSMTALSVKASIFGEKQSSMQATIDDLENTDTVLLSFLSKKRKGALVITVNGNEVFSGEISSDNPTPISINSKFLLDGNNKIEFATEKPGWMFWRVNRHELENIQLTGKVRDVSLQKSKNIFIVSATEKSNVKRSILRFTPECQTGKTGKLNVLINSHSVYYSVPDCGGRVAIEFTPDVLLQGENTIVFDSEQGNYIIDLIRITSELKSVVQPTYYFELPTGTVQDIRDGKYNLLLNLRFMEGTEQKSGTLNINGRETGIYQTEQTYSKNINDYVIDGNNAIKISPETDLEVVSLEVVKG